MNVYYSEWQVPNFGVQNQDLSSLQLISENDTCSTSDGKININIFIKLEIFFCGILMLKYLNIF